ncbi:hypothetical protein BR93DRAFT_971406 [Coniochaeta sp. PMI_546]|nr:hypothetical protein BR93DRAFT_971406 [Coniochaeta sp. PMI_546]
MSQTYGGAPFHTPEADLILLHSYLVKVGLYFAKLKGRLYRKMGSSNADLTDILYRVRDGLGIASRACGPGSRQRAQGSQEYVLSLLADSEPLTSHFNLVEAAWENLLQRTDHGRPNALLLAICQTVHMTEMYYDLVNRFRERVFEHRYPPEREPPWRKRRPCARTSLNRASERLEHPRRRAPFRKYRKQHH